jgi:hypothetical protein
MIQPNTRKEKEKANWYNTFRERPTDWLLVLFNGLLVASTIALFISAEKSADAAKASAEATQSAVQHAERTAERQLRAYICVLSVLKIPDPHETGTFGAQITIKNCGQTPAYEYSVSIRLTLTDNPLKEPLLPVAFTGIKTTLGPAADGLSIVELPRQLTKEELTAIDAGTKAVFVNGEVRFKDAFGAMRFVKFVWVCADQGYRIGRFQELENQQN